MFKQVKKIDKCPRDKVRKKINFIQSNDMWQSHPFGRNRVSTRFD